MGLFQVRLIAGEALNMKIIRQVPIQLNEIFQLD